VNKTVRQPDAGNDGGERHQRQQPHREIDHRKTDGDRKSAAQVRGDRTVFVGDADPADHQSGQGDHDGEERVPKAIGGEVEQAQAIRLAHHHAPGADEVLLDVFSGRHRA
jgi:hypothetical protein